MKYDALLDEANAEGISIKERPFKTYDGRIKGKDIYLRKDMNYFNFIENVSLFYMQ